MDSIWILCAQFASPGDSFSLFSPSVGLGFIILPLPLFFSSCFLIIISPYLCQWWKKKRKKNLSGGAPVNAIYIFVLIVTYRPLLLLRPLFTSQWNRLMCQVLCSCYGIISVTSIPMCRVLFDCYYYCCRPFTVAVINCVIHVTLLTMIPLTICQVLFKYRYYSEIAFTEKPDTVCQKMLEKLNYCFLRKKEAKKHLSDLVQLLERCSFQNKPYYVKCCPTATEMFFWLWNLKRVRYCPIDRVLFTVKHFICKVLSDCYTVKPVMCPVLSNG